MTGGWYAIFLREMLLFKKKFVRLGYLFSAMMMPLVYLAAFGLGLGRSVALESGSYLDFLLPGLVAMSSMNNSYNWVASALNLNRVYYKTFQVFVQAPVSPSAILAGEILAGMAKGLFASLLIIVVGALASGMGFFSLPFVCAVLVNCFLFASLGVITGMITKYHEDTATYSNFFIMPMAFFSGTFFPVSSMPWYLQWFIKILPLTHTNVLIRKASLDMEGIVSLGVLLAYSAVFFAIGARIIHEYSE